VARAIRLYEAGLRGYFQNMKPDESYKKLQKELQALIEKSDQSGQRSKIKKQLEKAFMAAWQFAPDRLRLGGKLNVAIDQFRTKDGTCPRGFDHCTYYTGVNDQRIIVTQPYHMACSAILQDLTLDNGVCPEIIDATEWAFYYPGRANLHIVKFPFGFAKAMQDFTKKLAQAKIDDSLCQIKAQNARLEAYG